MRFQICFNEFWKQIETGKLILKEISKQGGQLKIEIDTDWNIRMTGEVREIATGVLGA